MFYDDDDFDAYDDEVLLNKNVTAAKIISMLVGSSSSYEAEFLKQFPLPDKNKILAIVREAPALSTGDLISTNKGCKNPLHCVVGELFYRAGMSNKRLKEMQSRFGSDAETFPLWAHQILWRHYRLTPFHTAILIDDNDNGPEKINLKNGKTCTVANKTDLARQIEAFKAPAAVDIENVSMSKKPVRDFFAPFAMRAYKTWAKARLDAKAEEIAATRKRIRTLKLKAK